MLKVKARNRESVPARLGSAGTLVLVGCLCAVTVCQASSVRLATGALGSGVTVRGSVSSVKELRERDVVMQERDYSCGSAALSTIMTYYMYQPVSEAEIIEFILKTGDLKTIVARRGFSLLDLKRFATAKGATAQGFGMDLESLSELDGPIIVPMKIRGRDHFAIYLGTREGRVFLADPAVGRRTMPGEDFDRLWSPKVGLVISGGESGEQKEKERRERILSQFDSTFLDFPSLRTLLMAPPMPSSFLRGMF